MFTISVRLYHWTTFWANLTCVRWINFSQCETFTLTKHFQLVNDLPIRPILKHILTIELWAHKNGTSGRIRISSCFRHGLTVRYLTCSVHTGIWKWRIVQDSNLRAPIKRPTIFKIVVLWPLHQLSIKLVVPEGLEPSLLSKADFLTNYSFHCLVVGLVCGLDFTFSISYDLGGCRQVSTPSFISKGLARYCHFTGFTEFDIFSYADFSA